MSSALRSIPLPLRSLLLLAAPLTACAAAPADQKQATQSSTAATEDHAKEAPTASTVGATAAVDAPPRSSTPVPESTLSNEPAAASEGNDCVDAGHELEDYPYIRIGGARSIAEQVRLFPGDKVRIVGTDREPKKVRFGFFWQSYRDDKEYVVSGTGPVTPAFDFGDYGSSEIGLKLLVKYRCHVTEKRDIGTHVGPRPKK